MNSIHQWTRFGTFLQWFNHIMIDQLCLASPLIYLNWTILGLKDKDISMLVFESTKSHKKDTILQNMNTNNPDTILTWKLAVAWKCCSSKSVILNECFKGKQILLRKQNMIVMKTIRCISLSVLMNFMLNNFNVTYLGQNQTRITLFENYSKCRIWLFFF